MKNVNCRLEASRLSLQHVSLLGLMMLTWSSVGILLVKLNYIFLHFLFFIWMLHGEEKRVCRFLDELMDIACSSTIYFTKLRTCYGPFGVSSASKQRELRAQIPHEHHRHPLLSIPSTCMHRSSGLLPYPISHLWAITLLASLLRNEPLRRILVAEKSFSILRWYGDHFANLSCMRQEGSANHGKNALLRKSTTNTMFRTVHLQTILRLTFSWTLSRESGESTAKQIRITWESG